jgi:hypothetical protein
MGLMAMMMSVTSTEFSIVFLWKFEPELFLSAIEVNLRFNLKTLK